MDPFSVVGFIGFLAAAFAGGKTAEVPAVQQAREKIIERVEVKVPEPIEVKVIEYVDREVIKYISPKFTDSAAWFAGVGFGGAVLSAGILLARQHYTKKYQSNVEAAKIAELLNKDKKLPNADDKKAVVLAQDDPDYDDDWCDPDVPKNFA